MAFGTSSKIFTSYLTDVFNNTTNSDLNTDTINIALFNNSVSPDQTVASASTAYNAGTWLSGNEVVNTGSSSGSPWVAGGLPLVGIASSFSGATYTFDANDKTGGATDTIANCFGCLIFNNAGTPATPVPKQGICYLAFGGVANGVGGGTFTVSFNVAGIMQFTV